MPKVGKQTKFVIAAAYDTETTNLGNDSSARAFPVLFIINDLRDRDLYTYDSRDDKVLFYRTEAEMLGFVAKLIVWGRIVGVVPIVCAYNLMFDLQPLMQGLDSEYDIRVNAQSSTNVYTLDLYEQDTNMLLLRFWDTYHLEMRGLAAMGETAGLSKAVGDWDYGLVRTPSTRLSNEELFYAARDVQVIPAYLRYLLHANEWMRQEDLGCKVITKTSIVRQMARRKIGTLFYGREGGRRLSLDKAFVDLCLAERPATFGQYALRKACFRGGFTFTAAAYASTIEHNVASLDVTSMHHTFINGRFVPVDFLWCSDLSRLRGMCDLILGTSLEYILDHYERPFDCAIHARIKFSNLRLRKGSCFERWGIALLSTSKFKRESVAGSDIGLDPRAVAQENVVKSYGWFDNMRGGVTALGKLYEADVAVLDLSELELWCVGQVYEWDSYDVLLGEATSIFKRPPDFVTLQSNELFEMKSRAKYIANHYKEGEPYVGNLSGIPDGIARELENGTCGKEFFESWYTSTVKGMFNGIYGTMAQDVYKPDYKEEGGELVVNEDTRTTPENWNEHNDKRTLRVLYTYGLRIVGGSRLHMVAALELLDRSLGEGIRVLGGDTDSIKAGCEDWVTDDLLELALRPLGIAAEAAIGRTLAPLREKWPDKASSLCGVGSFDIENRGRHYDTHLELWNKCRVSWDGSSAHVTCAGLSRPVGELNIETIIPRLAKKYGIEYVLQTVIGYNVCVMPHVSHALEAHSPSAKDCVDMDVTDWRGDTRHVTAHQSTALYPIGRWLGETTKLSNATTVAYLADKYGRHVDTRTRYVDVVDNRIVVYIDTVTGPREIMGVEV